MAVSFDDLVPGGQGKAAPAKKPSTKGGLSFGDLLPTTSAPAVGTPPSSNTPKKKQNRLLPKWISSSMDFLASLAPKQVARLGLQLGESVTKKFTPKTYRKLTSVPKPMLKQVAGDVGTIAAAGLATPAIGALGKVAGPAGRILGAQLLVGSFGATMPMSEGHTPTKRDVAGGILLGTATGAAGETLSAGLARLLRRAPEAAATTAPRVPKAVRASKPTPRTPEAAKTVFDFVEPQELPVTPKAANQGRFQNPARSVEGRLESMGPQGQQVARLFREADTVGLVNTGKVSKAVMQSGLTKLTPEENLVLGDALRGRVQPQTLSPKIRQVFNNVDAYRQTVPVRARAYGVQVRTSRGKTFDFPEARKNYFPQNTPPVEALKKGQLRQEVLDNTVRSKRFASPQDAAKALDSYIELIEKNGRTKNDFFARKLIEEGQAKTLTEAKGKVLRFFRASRQQRYGNLERARELNFPFYDPNPQRVISRYIANVERRLAEAQVLGPNLERVDTLLGSLRDPEAQATARFLVKVARGAEEPGDTVVDKLLMKGRRVGTFRLSPLSAITNLSQNVNNIMAADASSWVKGLVRGFRGVGKDLALESGAIAESSLRQVQKMAGGDTGLVAKYLRATGFTPSERFNRVTSANTGWYYAQKMAKRLLQKPADNFARVELRALELNPDKLLQQGGLTHNDLLRAVKVFVDRTQFRSRAIDLPALFTKSAIGRNVSQFKTFSYQQGRFLARETVDELRSGNPGRMLRNLALLATVYPLTGEAVADIRALLQGRQRRTKGLTRYFEDLSYVGGLGLLTDTIQSLRYNPSEFLIGPSGALVTRNLQAAYKALTGSLSRGDRRQFVGQIPGLGPLISNRLYPPNQPNP